MSSIKIKNFGPINEGFADNDGFLPIDKLMIFIGGQGSGKSSVVKLISTLTWLEKGIVKKSLAIDSITQNDSFKTEWCEYQSIQNYFRSNSYIEYIGKQINFKYDAGVVEVALKDDKYEAPKITYIPAERNFLSVLEELENVKGLPKSLSWILEEYTKACRSLIKPISIHINDIKFEYNKLNKTSYISGEGFIDLKLSEASSGIQSVVPMMLVFYYLKHFITNSKLNTIDNLTFSEKEALRSMELNLTSNTNLSQDEFQDAMSYLHKKFISQNLFYIVEEIEQNLFPQSQKNILFKGFEFNNDKKDNHLILTTHSPYIIAYTTLAMKAFMIKEKANGNEDLIKKIETIVPLESCVNPDLTGIYQIDKGKIISIKSERGLILDNNFLNNSLEKTNELFNELLDIEEECKR